MWSLRKLSRVSFREARPYLAGVSRLVVTSKWMWKSCKLAHDQQAGDNLA